jgi:hypothetical protein
MMVKAWVILELVLGLVLGLMMAVTPAPAAVLWFGGEDTSASSFVGTVSMNVGAACCDDVNFARGYLSVSP